MLKSLNTRMKESAALRIVLIILACISLGGLFILGIFSNFRSLLSRSTPFPINMHSSVQANYQADPAFMEIPPMDIQLVVDAIWDQNLSADTLSLRLTQVNDTFLSSVASVTPKPTATNTSVPDLSPTASNITTTVDLTPSYTPTETPIGFIASPTATGAIEIPTETVPPPTDTIPAPTATLPPPTNTVSPCSQLTVGNFNTSAKKATWRITNNSSDSVSLDRIALSWPAANGNLAQVLFDQSSVWEGSESPPSIVINPGSAILGGNSTKKLDFIFIDQAVSTGYNLTVTLDGCVLSSSK